MKQKKVMSLRTKTNFMFAMFILFTMIFLLIINKHSMATLKKSVIGFNSQSMQDKSDYWDKRLTEVGTYIVNITYQERNLPSALRLYLPPGIRRRRHARG